MHKQDGFGLGVCQQLSCLRAPSPPCLIQVYFNATGSLKLGCLAQAMMVAPKDAASTRNEGVDGMDGKVDGEVDMEIEVSKCLHT